MKQVSFRVPDEVMIQLKTKVLQQGTTIQELFFNYTKQYLNEKSEVFVKPDILFKSSEEVQKIIGDTERLLDRLKEVGYHFKMMDALQSDAMTKDEQCDG